MESAEGEEKVVAVEDALSFEAGLAIDFAASMSAVDFASARKLIEIDAPKRRLGNSLVAEVDWPIADEEQLVDLVAKLTRKVTEAEGSLLDIR